MSEFSVDVVIEPVEMTFFALNLGAFDSAQSPLMNYQPFLRTTRYNTSFVKFSTISFLQILQFAE